MQRQHWGDSIQLVTQQPFMEHRPRTTGSEDPAVSKTAPNLSLGELTFLVGRKTQWVNKMDRMDLRGEPFPILSQLSTTLIIAEPTLGHY